MQRRLTCVASLIILALLVQAAPIRAMATEIIEDTGLQAAREAKAKSAVQNAFEQHKKVRVTLDGNRNFVGRVTSASDKTFMLADAKTGEPQQVSYGEVKEVKRQGLSRGAKIGIGVGIGLGAIVAGSVIAFKPWRSE